MKLPNGYGTVTKLSGNRRKPYVVKEGISGKQKPIGYTATREEGLILLAQYNNDPWDIQTDRQNHVSGIIQLVAGKAGCQVGGFKPKFLEVSIQALCEAGKDEV